MLELYSFLNLKNDDFMKFPKHLFKQIGLVLMTMIAIITLGLFILSRNPVHLSNDFVQKLVRHYNPALTSESKNAQLKFENYAIQLTIPELKLIKNNEQQINLSEFNFLLNVWRLTAQLTAQINKSELLAFVDVKDKVEQKMIDQFVNKNHILFDGRININFTCLGFNKLDLDLISSDGWHIPEKRNLSQIKLQKANLSLSYIHNKLSVNQLELQYNNSKASLNGDFIFANNDLVSTNFQAAVTNLPLDYLAGLWPKILFPEIHDWVTTHITDGVITKAQGKFNLTEEDLCKEFPSKESIDAEIEISNASLYYLENYSPIKAIEGKVKIDGQALHVNASAATMLSNSLANIEVILPFDGFILALKTNASGKLSQFKEFIPEEIRKKLLGYGINFNSIKGNISGLVELSIPIFDPFKLANLKLNIKANLENVIVDKFGVIQFKQGDIELINEQGKISLKLNGQKKSIFNFTKYYPYQQQNDDRLNVIGQIEVSQKMSLYNKIEINKGIIKVNADITEDKWQTNLDLTEAEVTILTLGYTKPAATKFAWYCSGKVEEDYISSENCKLEGKDFAGQIAFTYALAEGKMTNFMLNNAQIGPNNSFNLEMSLKENFHNYKS